MKLLICILLISPINPLSAKSQQNEQVDFWGYTLIEYQQPIKISQNQYEPYYKQVEETNYPYGRIILTKNTFTIKWINGEDWVAKIQKKETKDEIDSFFKAFKKIIYTGKWIEDNVDCELEITLTETMGCMTVLKSKRVVDENFKINTYKKFFRFHAEGNCFEEAKLHIAIRNAAKPALLPVSMATRVLRKAIRNAAKPAPDSSKNLNNRKIIYQEPLVLDSYKKVKLVFNICVDKSGNIIIANYNRLSTTADLDLIKQVKTKLLLYKYNADENAPEKQCGTITLQTTN